MDQDRIKRGAKVLADIYQNRNPGVAFPSFTFAVEKILEAARALEGK